MRVKYESELDGLSKRNPGLGHQLVHFITSSNVALLVRLTADHLPMSAILLAVQLQTPDCSDVTNLLPVSVRQPRMTLAAFSIVAESSWRLALTVREIVLDSNAGEQTNVRSWYTALCLITLKTINVFGLSATTALASLSLVIQLMTSQLDVAPPGLPRIIGQRIQLENWIEANSIIGHVTNASHVTSLIQVFSLAEFLNRIEDSNYDVISQSVSCPQSVLWDTSKCATTDINSVMDGCFVKFNFRVAEHATIEYNYAYRLTNDSLIAVNDACKQSFKDSKDSIAQVSMETCPQTDTTLSESSFTSSFNSTLTLNSTESSHQNHATRVTLTLNSSINYTQCSQTFIYVANLLCSKNVSNFTQQVWTQREHL